MDYHKIEVGIEHLMTGIIFQLDGEGNAPVLQFVKISASIMAAVSIKPFSAYWPNRASLKSTPFEGFKQEYASDGEIEFLAQVIGAEMQATEDRCYKMQAYTRPSRKLDDGEPTFTPQVVKAFKRKHGKDANVYLCQLRWNHDHWFYNHAGMYLAVFPDGGIHT